MHGGAKDLLSGRTSPKHVRFFAVTTSRICQPISVFTIFVLPESREAQADLARQYGVTGFCYYHYWFSGKRLLHRPFDEVLTSGRPNFPFCLCWANENWTRIWDGGDSEVLMEQRYSDEDDRAHIRWLASAFTDPRYIRVENKPLFIIYRAHKLPNIRKTTATWRDECRRLGIGEVFLCRVDTGRGCIASEGSWAGCSSGISS